MPLRVNHELVNDCAKMPVLRLSACLMAQVLGLSAKRDGVTTPGLTRGKPSIENCRVVETFQNVSSNANIIALGDGRHFFRRSNTVASQCERSRRSARRQCIVACRCAGDSAGVGRKRACPSGFLRQVVPANATSRPLRNIRPRCTLRVLKALPRIAFARTRRMMPRRSAISMGCHPPRFRRGEACASEPVGDAAVHACQESPLDHRATQCINRNVWPGRPSSDRSGIAELFVS